MATILRAPVVFIFLILTLISCGGGKDPRDTQSGGSELDGNWSQSCTKASGDYINSKFLIGGNTFTLNGTYYSDSNCTTKLFSMNYSGVFTIGAPVSTPANAKAFDIKLNEGDITLHEANYVSLYNGFNICGFSDWKLEEKRSCNLFTNKTFYSLYAIEDNILRLGDTDKEHGGETAETRPVQLVPKEEGYVR